MMRMNKNSNVYTIVYIILLVLVVGASLSLIYQALRPAQIDNMANDKKRQILAAAHISPDKGESISDLYNKYITTTIVVNLNGDKVQDARPAFDINVANEVKKSDDKRLLPVYICQIDKEVKYIIPAYGAGLWGPIWGYIALDSDGKTIYGAYFAHQGETPGLGAEIEKPAFSNQFEGKQLYNDGQFEPIKVVKNGAEPSTGSYVHAISGGTITSQGVQKMLDNSLRPYDAYFRNIQNKDK